MSADGRPATRAPNERAVDMVEDQKLVTKEPFVSPLRERSCSGECFALAVLRRRDGAGQALVLRECVVAGIAIESDLHSSILMLQRWASAVQKS